MAKPALLLLVGPPGSGKSYFAERFAPRHNFVHINSDQVRMRYFNNPTFSPSERNRVYDKIFELAQEAIDDNKSVILDCNLVTNTDRETILKKFEPSARVLFAYFAMAQEIALARATNRKKTDDMLYKPMDPTRAKAMHEKFEPIALTLPHVTLNGIASFEQNQQIVLSTLNQRPGISR